MPTLERIAPPPTSAAQVASSSPPRPAEPAAPPVISGLWGSIEGPMAWEIRRAAAQQGIAPEVLAQHLVEAYLVPFPVPASLEAGLRAAATSSGQPPQAFLDRALRAIQAPRLGPPFGLPLRGPRLGGVGGCLTPFWLIVVAILLLAGAMACCWVSYVALLLAAHTAHP